METSHVPKDVRHFVREESAAIINFPLSEAVQDLTESTYDEASLADSVRSLVEQSEIVWKPEFGTRRIVLQCSPGIALKIVLNLEDFTEYTALQYLQEHKPSIPAPRPTVSYNLGNASSSSCPTGTYSNFSSTSCISTYSHVMMLIIA